MANPIIIDDGGSTRIKRILNPSGIGDMDSLLKVEPPATGGPPQSSHTVDKAHSKLIISLIEENGAAYTTEEYLLSPRDYIKVTSHYNQTVNVELDGNSNATITIIGTTNNPPLVSAKQANGKRRYVVENAGTIKRIDFSSGGTAYYQTVQPNCVYTSVAIIDQ